MKLYIVEDDPALSEAVKEYLERELGEVTVFSTEEAARKAIEKQLPSLILIDWNLPGGSGAELLRWLRSRWSDLPVILLTVRDSPRDMVTGFQLGADDYVSKPFDLAVLCSRIRALLRRSGNTAGERIRCGSISIDCKRTVAYRNERELALSAQEYQLLCLLVQKRGATVTREELLRRIWDVKGNFVNDNTLTVTVKRLREKLGSPGCLKTVRSIGYRLEEW